jgi:hypothetical protein
VVETKIIERANMSRQNLMSTQDHDYTKFALIIFFFVILSVISSNFFFQETNPFSHTNQKSATQFSVLSIAKEKTQIGRHLELFKAIFPKKSKKSKQPKLHCLKKCTFISFFSTFWIHIRALKFEKWEVLLTGFQNGDGFQNG